MRRSGFAPLDVATVMVAVCALVLTGLTVRDRIVGPRSDAGPAAMAEISDWKSYSLVGHHVGPKSAPVTLVEFVDYQCPACAMFAKTLRQVHTAHPNDLAVVYRHWPLSSIHPLAANLARGAECAAQQGVFEAYHDLVFQVHDSLGLITIEQLGVRAGVHDSLAFTKCARSTAPVEAIERDTIAVKRLGGRGTPTILINNKRLTMIPDSAKLEELIHNARTTK